LSEILLSVFAYREVTLLTSVINMYRRALQSLS